MSQRPYHYEAVPTTEVGPLEAPALPVANLAPPPTWRKYPQSPSPMGSLDTLPGNAKRRADRRLMRLNTELLQAILDNNLEEVQRCLAHDATANATCKPARISSCHIASFLGYTEILRVLLENGAQLGARDAMGRTPLHLAAWEGNPDCVKLLLEHAADLVNVKTEQVRVKNKIPPEWVDSWDHDHDAVIDMMPRLEFGSTPLHVACKRTESICVQHLLAAGADWEMTDSRGLRPLDVVGENLIEHREEGDVEFRYPGVIKALISAGDQHYLSKEYDLQGCSVTPLHTAVELESLEAISVLLEANFPRAVWNMAGETPMHLCIRKRLADPLKLLVNTLNAASPKDYLDPENSLGMTPLQLAVWENWVPGVSIVLEAGADVTVTSRDGYTALHFAAASGNLELMREILSIPDAQSIIEVENQLGETPLFCAISGGNLGCVEELLQAGARLEHRLHGGVTVFHRAAEHGCRAVLQTLIVQDPEATKKMINLTDSLKMSGMTPLQMAAQVGHADCVQTLLDAGADIIARTTREPHYEATALHLAATENHHEVVRVLLKTETFIVDVQDIHGWMPLHVACYHCNRECIRLLIDAGADLSAVTVDAEKNRRSAMSFLVYNVPRPVEFLESILDSMITINECTINETNCLVTIDYHVLAPRGRNTQQMRVINALMNTGNQFGQKRLLIHPLIESFLYLKWRALSTVFMVILGLYVVFVMATTQLITGIYYYEDKGEEPPLLLDTRMSRYTLLLSLAPIALQELLHAKQRSWSYFKELESWVKWGSFILSTVVVFAEHGTSEWSRHVAAVAVLLAWTELMFLLSRFPEWGYYVLMFSKVATNVVKVLLTFGFLVIGFTFSFLVQFRGEPPFGSPWQSFVKTMVMMTSEFDYSDLFTDQENYIVTVTIGRLVFVAFLVLAAIVLMNLMVGMAVNDINDLEIRGKTQRLFKQVNFLCSLDLLVYNESMLRCLPCGWRSRVENGRFVDLMMYVYPGRPLRTIFKTLPSVLKDEIIQNAIANRKSDEPTLADVIGRLDNLEQRLVSRQKTETADSKATFADVAKEGSKVTQISEKSIAGIVEDLSQLREDSATKWEKADSTSEAMLQALNHLRGQLDQLREGLSSGSHNNAHVVNME